MKPNILWYTHGLGLWTLINQIWHQWFLEGIPHCGGTSWDDSMSGVQPTACTWSLQVGATQMKQKGKNHLLHRRFAVSSWVISAERNFTYFITTKNDWDGTWALSYSCTDSCHLCLPKINSLCPVTHVTPLLFWFWGKACKHLSDWQRANGWSVSQAVGLRYAYIRLYQ